jgi:outer membrane protein
MAFTASAALAQAPTGGPPEGWTVSLGAGAIASPDHRGSSTYRVRPIPAITARHGDDFAFSGLEANYTPVRAGPWTAGAQGRFRFGQRESDNRVALRGLGGVDPSVELGGFVGYGQGPISLKASLAQDVAGGHGGQVAALGAAYSTVLRRTAAGPVLLSAGPSVSWASGKFNRAYYGVDAAQAGRSGLTPYRPGSGLESTGVSANLIAPLNRRVTLIGIAGFDRLIDKAADSPRVRLRGSRNQATIGAFLTYRLF